MLAPTAAIASRTPATLWGARLSLNRQAETFGREGIELETSTLADWVGACTAVLSPLVALIHAHVMAAERLHGDDTPVPVLARGHTTPGRLWTYVRDNRPFAGPAPPAALFHYSPDRRGEHPQRHLATYAGILQADAYAGFGDLYRKRCSEALADVTTVLRPVSAPSTTA